MIDEGIIVFQNIFYNLKYSFKYRGQLTSYTVTGGLFIIHSLKLHYYEKFTSTITIGVWESWINKTRSKLIDAEMRVPRQNVNKMIRDETRKLENNIHSNKNRRELLGWYGYLVRIQDERIVKEDYEAGILV